MLPRKRSVAMLGLFLVLCLRCEGRTVDAPPSTADEGEGDDYLEEYTGVDEEAIGVGPNGQEVLGEVFGSGLRDETPGELRETVDRVEKLLAANPDLPRLSRGEILEIYRNLTSDKTTLRPDNSLLVVLPFNAQDVAPSDMEDLFTRQPVTRMMGAEFQLPVKVAPQGNDITYGDKKVKLSPVYKPHSVPGHAARPSTNHYRQTIDNYSRAKPGYTSTPTPGYKSTPQSAYKTTPQSEQKSTPQSAYKSIPQSEQKSTPQSEYTSTPKPVYKSTTRLTYTSPPRPDTPKHQNYGPTSRPGQYENNQINKNVDIHSTRLTYTSPPRPKHQNYEPTSRPAQHSKENNQINKNVDPSSTQRPSLVQYNKRKKPTQEGDKTTTNRHPAIQQYQDVNPFRPMPLPKQAVVLENHRLPPQDSNKVDSNIKLRPATEFEPVKTTEQPIEDKPHVRNDIQTVLASLGLFPDKIVPEPTTTIKPTVIEPLTADMKSVLESLGLLPAASNILPVVYAEPEPSTVLKPATTPSVDVNSYSNFKPLPSGVDDREDSELKQILAKFGLVPGEGSLNFDSLDQIDVTGHRDQKAMATENAKKNKIESENKKEKDEREEKKEKTEKEEKTKREEKTEVNVDGMSQDMKDVLESLGLVTPTTPASPEGHIFNPVSQAASLDPTLTQQDKLNQLISTIQLLAKDNETFTPEEIEELNQAFNLQPIMERANQSEVDSTVTTENNVLPLDQLLGGPDPLTTDELIDLYIKNEVKRQQPDNVTIPPSTTEAIAPSKAVETTTPAVTEERLPALTDFTPQGDVGGTDEGAASLADLADSFGGGETADQTVSEADLPEKKPNGLYFLLDWNSFLEVGEEGKNKTTIRFTPRVGNSKNFLPVTVP